MKHITFSFSCNMLDSADNATGVMSYWEMTGLVWCVLERSLSVAGVEMRRVVSVSNAAAVTARVPPAALQMKRETIMPYILLGILKIQAQEMGNEVKNWSTKMVHLDVLFAHGSEAPVQSAVTTEMTGVSPTMSPSHRTTQWAGHRLLFRPS